LDNINCFETKREKEGLTGAAPEARYIINGYIHRRNTAAMPKNTLDPEKGLPLTPAVFHVLLALVDSERHGYAIMQEVACCTRDQIKMGPGTLYGTIKRLLAAGWIEESDRRPDPELDDGRRRYYRLTGLGVRMARAEALRYQALAELVRRKKLFGNPARAGHGGHL
jgi:DNA-binding PadR family transcriptional regulator